MLEDFTSKGELQCRNKEGCSLSYKMCSLMKNCNGNGSCNNGKCLCEKGFSGADCSIAPSFIDKEVITLGQNEWAHY